MTTFDVREQDIDRDFEVFRQLLPDVDVRNTQAEYPFLHCGFRVVCHMRYLLD